MKALTRKTELPKIIGINLQNVADKIMDIANVFNVETRFFGEDIGGETIGYLCGIHNFSKPNNSEIVTDSLLIFSNLDNVPFNKILNRLKMENINIPLKAIATNTNAQWTVCQLAKELKKEHYLMNGGEKND